MSTWPISRGAIACRTRFCLFARQIPHSRRTPALARPGRAPQAVLPTGDEEAVAVLDGPQDVLDGHDGRNPCPLQIFARLTAVLARPRKSSRAALSQRARRMRHPPLRPALRFVGLNRLTDRDESRFAPPRLAGLDGHIWRRIAARQSTLTSGTLLHEPRSAITNKGMTDVATPAK